MAQLNLYRFFLSSTVESDESPNVKKLKPTEDGIDDESQDNEREIGEDSSGSETENSNNCDSDTDDLDLPLDVYGSSSASTSTNDSTTSQSDTCNSNCCIMSQVSQPNQPRSISRTATRRKQGNQNRTMCSSWFTDHSWLSFCESRGKVFCYYCRKAYLNKYVTFSTKFDQAFITKGYDNWKHAKARFRNHESSRAHRESVLNCAAAAEKRSVAVQLQSQMQKVQNFRREMLLKKLSSLKFLLRQGLAIRGHHEEEGNLHQLLTCRSEDVKELREWLKEGKYLSHDINNELIEMMAHVMLRNLLSEIKEMEWYSMIADETRDTSGKEQLTISLRWLDKRYNVHEDLIGLVEVTQTDALTVSQAIRDVLLRCNLQLGQCRGQAYDGASNMSGRFSGVATRIQQLEPKAHYIHCMAHCLNLCLQECGSQCRIIRDALHLVADLSNLIRSSPKRLGLFLEIRDAVNPRAPGLKPLCPTRWTVRTHAIDAVIKNYDTIYQELEQIAEERHDDTGVKASGFAAKLEKFATYVGLKLSFLVFSATEQLSITLQTSGMNAQEALTAAKAAKLYLERQRSETAFDLFWKSCEDESPMYEFVKQPVLPRPKQPPKWYNSGAQNHVYTSPKESFRQQYYEVVDLLVNEMDRRFDQKTFSILQEMEKLLVEPCNGIKVHMSTEFTVDRLLSLYLTIPMTTATAERSFSALRRLKNYLRTTMTQQRYI